MKVSLQRPGYVEVDDVGPIHFRGTWTTDRHERGAVLYLHKTASSSRSFEAVMAAVGGQHRQFALDTPGFGESSSLECPADIGDYVRTLRAAALCLASPPFHLVGHHTGSSIATAWASEYADEVASLGLIGLALPTLEERASLQQRFSGLEAPDMDATHVTAIWSSLKNLGADTPKLLNRELIDNLKAGPARGHAYAAVWSFDAGAALARVVCPVLLLTSSRDVLHEHSTRARDFNPGVRIATVGGSNFQLDEVPGQVARLLENHWRESTSGDSISDKAQ